MIVYHGSTSIVEKPDILHSKRFLDFGRGFYVTSYKSQAERWAKRKSIRNGLNPTVNSYAIKSNFLLGIMVSRVFVIQVFKALQAFLGQWCFYCQWTSCFWMVEGNPPGVQKHAL